MTDYFTVFFTQGSHQQQKKKHVNVQKYNKKYLKMLASVDFAERN